MVLVNPHKWRFYRVLDLPVYLLKLVVYSMMNIKNESHEYLHQH